MVVYRGVSLFALWLGLLLALACDEHLLLRAYSSADGVDHLVRRVVCVARFAGLAHGAVVSCVVLRCARFAG